MGHLVTRWRSSNQYYACACACKNNRNQRVLFVVPRSFLGWLICTIKVVKKASQLLMTGKAYNNRVIAEWLHDVVQRARGSSTDPRMPLAYLCMIL